MQLQLKKFDISSIASDSVVVMIGKRNTGKSFLIKDMMYYHRDIPVGTVISATEGANKFFSSIVPPVFIHDQYTPAVVENTVKRQKILQKKVDQQLATTGRCNIDMRSFLIMDDCLFDNSWAKDTNIRLIFLNGRHHKLFFCLTMQYPLGIPPFLRTQIDYIFILRENIVSNRKRVYDNYAGMFPTFDAFCQVADQCTENYECLVIHNNAKSNKIEDQVFWYKASPRGDYKIGSPELWNYSNNICAAAAANGNDDGEDDYDISKVKKKNGPLISVKKT